uniref:tRNA-splicing endonuclease subunit Sen54 N-terminal domain-containing protein n=3 Tax=Octopus bimaculoides TaxID=37653 RepID=A0A0L8HDH5_OCTBM
MDSEVIQDFKKYFKPNCLLSAEQLVHQFKTADKTIPVKGGTKDFQPDGSWLQGKKLDMLYSTRETLFAEQRIDRLGSILIGELNREKNLVEYKSDTRKFWFTMGFVDEKRRWLYPEEALFLMEANALLVYNEKVPLSIQEGYQVFLGKSLTRIQYQVYAHLRRIGYIVFRFENKSEFASYEMTMNLNQYVKKKRKYDYEQYTSSSEEEDLEEPKRLSEINQAKKIRCADSNHKSEENDADVKLTLKEDRILEAKLPNSSASTNQNKSACKNSLRNSETGVCSEKTVQQTNLTDLINTSGNNDIEMKCNKKDKLDVNCENGKVAQNIESLTIENKSNVIKIKECMDVKDLPLAENCPQRNLYAGSVDDLNDCDSTGTNISHCSWDFNEYNIPNIGGQLLVHLTPPNDDIVTALLGEPLQLREYIFNVQEYRETVMCQHKYFRTTQNCLFRNEPLKYSFQKPTGKSKTDAKNWSEYKAIMEKEKVQKQNTYSSLRFLWEDDVKPLLSPEDNLSTDAILQKLQIIENAQLHSSSSKASRP